MDLDYKRWVGLTRVSTDRQAEHGYGLAVQEVAIERFVEEHKGVLVRIEQDPGISGKRDSLVDRVGLQNALRAIGTEKGQSGWADGIVVPRMDRLSRSLIGQETILADIYKAGAILASCVDAENEQLTDPDDPDRKFLRVVIGAMAEWERDKIVTRIKVGRARKIADGGYHGGPCPHGWQRDGNAGLKPLEPMYSLIGQMRTMKGMGAKGTDLQEFLYASAANQGQYASGWTLSVIRSMLARAEKRNDPVPMPLGPVAARFMRIPYVLSSAR